jgi:hypothetical protein
MDELDRHDNENDENPEEEEYAPRGRDPAPNPSQFDSQSVRELILLLPVPQHELLGRAWPGESE